MGALGVGIAVAGGLVAAAAAETAYFYSRTMIRQQAKMERTVKMAGTDWSQYTDFLTERKTFMMAQPHEDVYQTSFDGLKLHAAYFPPIKEDATGKKRVVICFHGYTSASLQDFTGLTGFGCVDRKDALKWIDWVIEHCGADVEILLHGISMGGATVLMASGMELPPQVKGIISDCGFTSPKEVFTHVLKTMYHLPSFPVMQGANLVNRKLAGYGMDECNASREVAKAKVPILFIHGEKDTFVPVWMCRKMYESCASKKKMLIVEGAAHGESYYKNTKQYEQALDEFLQEL